jgi:hypothetical protein
MRAGPIKPSSLHDRSYCDWNQQTFSAESASQCSFGHVNNVGADLLERFHTFSPLPFNAAVDAQWIYGTH